jgi:DNA-binding response OmpR family regulator
VKALFVESRGLLFDAHVRALKEAGVPVEAASDAQTALWLLAGGRYRVVILEIESDGLPWEVVAAALWMRPPARVIALVRGPIGAALRRRAYGAGIWELLEIPSSGSASQPLPAVLAAAGRALRDATAPSVLFVDGCSEITEGVGSLIEEEGFIVEPAGNVSEALRLMATRDYALIVTETNRIGADGFQVLRDAARLQPGVPVVVFTAALDDDTFLRAVELGARACVWKLAEPDEIMQEIRAVAQPGSAHGTSRT